MKEAKGCPICEGRFYEIKRSFHCCRKHRKWIVSKCDTCNRYCFTDLARLCPNCQKVSAHHVIGLGFNKDHRRMLHVYGLEYNSGWN